MDASVETIEQDLIDGLATDRSLDRYLVYADYLQTRGDPRGELIALAVHQRQTGVVDPRTLALQAQCEGQLVAPFEHGGVYLWWELGCPDALWIAPHAQPLIGDWLASPALALVRSFALVETAKATDAWPVDLIATAPFARLLERVAIGGVRAPASARALGELIDRLPSLIGLEIRGGGVPDPALLARLESFERLEELALWMKSRDDIQRRVFAGPWSKLRALTTTGMASSTTLPAFVEPVIDGTQFPALTELSIHASTGVGFEAAVIEQLGDRPLGKRLRKLGFDWSNVSDDALTRARDALDDVELVWPRPTGDGLSGGQSYAFARRLRLGMARNRLAVEHARDACDRAPRDYFHWAEYGYALGTLDRLPEKLAAMDRAIAIDPARWGAHVGKGDTLRDLSRFDEAEAEYTAAIAREPDRISLHNGLGLVHARRGNRGPALASFDRATELATGGDRALYACNAIEVAIEGDQLADAAERWERARVDAPDHRRLQRVGGYLRIYAGAPADALAITGDAVTATPTEDEYPMLSLYAAARRALGNRDAADAAYELIAGADCPAYIAFAWLGQTIAGTRDPLAAFVERDPPRLADAIAARVNASRAGVGKLVHTTEDRCDDRIHVAACATVAAVVANRGADARELAAGLAGFVAGPAPVKHNHWWLELAELVHVAVKRAATPELADLARRAYRIATGREQP